MLKKSIVYNWSLKHFMWTIHNNKQNNSIKNPTFSEGLNIIIRRREEKHRSIKSRKIILTHITYNWRISNNKNESCGWCTYKINQRCTFMLSCDLMKWMWEFLQMCSRFEVYVNEYVRVWNAVEGKLCTSGGGLAELPSEDRLAPSRPDLSLSDRVSESLSRDVVLGGDKWSVGVCTTSRSCRSRRQN